MSDNFVTKFLTTDTNGIPNWGWAGIIIAGLGIGVYVKNKFNSNSSPSTQPPASTYTGTGPVDTGTGITPTPTPTGPPTPAYPRQATVRSAGAVPTYDYSQIGPPVHTQANNTSPYAYQTPFGSSIQLLGSVQGGFNAGSTTWYLVTGGYISSFDIVGG